MKKKDKLVLEYMVGAIIFIILEVWFVAIPLLILEIVYTQPIRSMVNLTFATSSEQASLAQC